MMMMSERRDFNEDLSTERRRVELGERTKISVNREYADELRVVQLDNF